MRHAVPLFASLAALITFAGCRGDEPQLSSQLSLVFPDVDAGLGTTKDTVDGGPSECVRCSSEPGTHRATQISAGYFHSCATTDAHEVHCWGSVEDGRLGVPSAVVDAFEPVRVPGAGKVEQVVASTNFTLARTSEGAVYAWGKNDYGQLGIGSTQNKNAPTLVPSLTKVTQLSSTWTLACARTEQREVYTWGVGYGTNSNAPVKMTGLPPIDEVSCGLVQGCAVAQNHDLYCWGDNSSGQLGVGDTIARTGAVRVMGDVAHVAVGGCHTCAVSTTGALSCWGRNEWGQLGVGTQLATPTPTRVTALTNVTSVVAGMYHTCAITNGDALSCWGFGSSGAIGSGTTANEVSPVSTGLTGVVNVSAGTLSTCAQRENGELYCWGQTIHGMLGIGASEGAASALVVTPKRVSGF